MAISGLELKSGWPKVRAAVYSVVGRREEQTLYRLFTVLKEVVGGGCIWKLSVESSVIREVKVLVGTSQG